MERERARDSGGSLPVSLTLHTDWLPIQKIVDDVVSRCVGGEVGLGRGCLQEENYVLLADDSAGAGGSLCRHG